MSVIYPVPRGGAVIARQPSGWNQPLSTSADVTIALTGVTGTGSVGTLTANVSYAPTGVAGTGNTGTLLANVSYGLSGNEATGGVGTEVSNVSYGLTGVSGTGAVGNVSAGGDVTSAITGNEGAGGVGSLTSGVSYALTGVSSTGAVGDLAVSPDVVLYLTGVSGSGEVGSLTAVGGEAVVNAFGGRGRASRRSYVIRGKRYLLNEQELAQVLAQQAIQDAQLTREDVQVQPKNKKPHKISVKAWEAVKPSFDLDEEEAAAMLLL